LRAGTSFVFLYLFLVEALFPETLWRKILPPNDFGSLVELEDCLLRLQDRYQQIAAPFERNFTRLDLVSLSDQLKAMEFSHAA
jgi:hypothetical protein